VPLQEPPGSLTGLGWYESIELQSMGCLETSNPTQESNPMSTSLDLSKLSLMDALDLAILIEEEAHQRYKMFAAQVGGGGIEMFGKVPMNVKLVDLYDVEAPDTGAPRRGMSTIQAFEVGLAAEQKAYDFYDGALTGITDPEVRTLFTELRDEETEHVEMLREAMAKLPASASVETPNDPDDAPYL
jgi:rubrerythrin